MIRNFDKPILYKNQPVGSEDGKIPTQAGLIFDALMGYQGDLTPDDKMKMFRLGNKISTGGDVEIASEEIVLIKRAIEKLPPLSFGQIHDNLEAA